MVKYYEPLELTDDQSEPQYAARVGYVDEAFIRSGGNLFSIDTAIQQDSIGDWIVGEMVTATRSTDQTPRMGSHCLKVEVIDDSAFNGAWISQYFDVVAGTQYVFSFDAYRVTAFATIHITWEDDQGNPIAYSNYDGTESSAPTDEWFRLSLTDVAPAGATTAWVRTSVGSSIYPVGTVLYYDRFVFAASDYEGWIPPSSTSGSASVHAGDEPPADSPEHGVLWIDTDDLGPDIPPGDWVTPALSNSWIVYNSVTWGDIRYRIERDVVRLEGAIANGTIGYGSSFAVFTLPVGYRPPARRDFIVYTSGAVLGRVTVFPDGVVSVPNGDNAFVSLNGINFVAEQ